MKQSPWKFLNWDSNEKFTLQKTAGPMDVSIEIYEKHCSLKDKCLIHLAKLVTGQSDDIEYGVNIVVQLDSKFFTDRNKELLKFAFITMLTACESNQKNTFYLSASTAISKLK